MKKISTLAAILPFSGSSMASEGNTAFDDVNQAVSASNYSASTYSYSEATGVLDDVCLNVSIRVSSAPVSIGDSEIPFLKGSALGSLFYAE